MSLSAVSARLPASVILAFAAAVLVSRCAPPAGTRPGSPTAYSITPPAASSAECARSDSVMVAHFIDVGQADATLLEFPCGALLVDAGAQDSAHVDALIGYLDRFFARRADLDGTLESIILTHDHLDHTRALVPLVRRFHVHRLIDGGPAGGVGAVGPARIRAAADSLGIRVRAVYQREVAAAPGREGLTDPDIDPVTCAGCDPRIAVLSGRYRVNPGWPPGEFRDPNNQSLVVRVDFGGASFLFTGDLEAPAIETLLARYTVAGDSAAQDGPLDVDVYQVGHHGSHNATTPALLEAMTPEIAVISVGHWDSGRGSRDFYNTWHYGHPRTAVLDMLAGAIPGRRNPPVRVMAALRPRTFDETTVRKSIYATAWDGTVRVCGTLDGRFRVTGME